MSDIQQKLRAWMARAVPRDATEVKRWFVVTSEAMIAGQTILLLRRVLGWDDSPPPSWVASLQDGRVTVRSEELVCGEPLVFMNSFIERSTGRASLTGAVRRVEVPVSDWSQIVSADKWALRLPSVMYEIWPTNPSYDRVRGHWKELTGSEQKASAVHEAGHLGSTIFFLPQRRPYFAADNGLTPYLVLPAQEPKWENLQITSEVFDGIVCISRSIAPLQLEPWREIGDREGFNYLKIRKVSSSFASMNALDLSGPADALAAFPIDAHGRSGSDWRISVIGPLGFDSYQLGLIRLPLEEPWHDRIPALGFSAPARVEYIPPADGSLQTASAIMLHAGSPLWVCDPYAEAAAFAPLLPILRSGRILTRQRRITQKLLTEEWARSQGIEVRVQSDALHDRFIVGPQRAFLIGTSLNGIGKSHSFLTELDAVMRVTVRDVFEELWNTANAPW